ncbi:hypothetical protein B0H10DRAFT_1961676, partial [Mycena sp. CBHHK59/15]
ASNSNMAKAKKQPAKKKKKGRPSYVQPESWSTQGPSHQGPTLVKIIMTGPGLKEEDPLMILDDEDDDDIKIVEGPPATLSSLASRQPQQPLHQPLISSVFTPLSALGSRLPRMVALRQPARRTQMSYLFGAKVEPGCGNVHTLVLLCVYMSCLGIKLQLPSVHKTHVQTSSSCYRPRGFDGLYPNMPDNTAVEWGRAWDGLNFPVDI